MPAYKVVFIAAGFGMLVSLVWFYIGRGQLKGIGAPPPGQANRMRVIYVAIGARAVRPAGVLLLAVGAQESCSTCSPRCSSACAVMLMVEGIREGNVARDKTIAMLLIFVFNIMFWMFFEQAGSSFTFLADQIVEPPARQLDASRRAGSRA